MTPFRHFLRDEDENLTHIFSSARPSYAVSDTEPLMSFAQMVLEDCGYDSLSSWVSR